jgi:hypothetical protein
MGGGGEDAEDGGVNVVDGNGTYIDEFCEIVFVWDLSNCQKLVCLG